MSRSKIFNKHFKDRSYIATSVQPNLDKCSFYLHQSSSNHNQIKWTLQTQNTSTKFYYNVIGPPALIAACSWLTHQLNQTSSKLSDDELEQTCIDTLKLKTTEHHFVGFVIISLKTAIKDNNISIQP